MILQSFLSIRRNLFSILIIIFFFISNSACTSIVGIHGYSPVDKKPEEIIAGKDTKATVLSELGSPSTKSVFDDEVWYYMSSRQSAFGFSKRKETKRKVIAVRFDENGLVKLVDSYTLGDRNKITLASGKTPTYGRELSVFEQLLGNIGRLPQGQTAKGQPGR